MGPRGAGKSTLIKMAMDLGVNYVPAYTTEWLHGHSRRGRLLRRMEPEAFNAERFYVQTGCRGYQYGWYKRDVLEAMDQHPTNIMLITEAAITPFRNLLRRNLVTIFLMSDYTTLVSRMAAEKLEPEKIQEEMKYAEDYRILDGWRYTDYVIKNMGSKEVAFQQLLAIMGLTQPLPENELKAQLG